MRISWPLGIILSFVLFAGFMIGFAVYSTQNPPELVADNYYELDSEYELLRTRIEHWNRISPTDSPPVWEQDSLVLFLPPMLIDSDSGRVEFYKPDRRALDFSMDWKQLTATNGRIAAELLAKGRWMVSLKAWKNGKGYAKNYNIQKP